MKHAPNVARGPAEFFEPDSARLAAIVVLFHPELDHVCARAAELAACGIRVILVDNSADAGLSDAIRSRVTSRWPVHYIEVGYNSGIAAALNAGVREARIQECTHVLLLDQDSTLEPKTIRLLLSRFIEMERSGLVVAGVGPDPVNARDGEPLGVPLRVRNRTLFRTVRRRSEVITSGFVTSVRVLEDVGPFMEELFIDFVDFEWCWRARARGYALGVDAAAPMAHRLGARDIKLLWRKAQVHAPIRNYYQYRNFLLVSRLPHCPMYFVLRRGASLLARFALLPFFTAERADAARYIARGICDGIRAVTGPFRPERS